MNKLLAQVSHPLGPIGGNTGFGPLGNITSGVGGINAIARVVSTILGLMTVVAGIYLLFQLITASFNWMSSSGDKGKLEKAQLQMTQSLTGLIVVVAVYAIASIIGTVLGLDLLLQRPGDIINQLNVTP